MTTKTTDKIIKKLSQQNESEVGIVLVDDGTEIVRYHMHCLRNQWRAMRAVYSAADGKNLRGSVIARSENMASVLNTVKADLKDYTDRGCEMILNTLSVQLGRPSEESTSDLSVWDGAAGDGWLDCTEFLAAQRVA